MPTPKGPQFVQLYRGIYGVTPSTMRRGALGRHWSTNPKVAESFAYDEGDDKPSVVIGALVNKKHVIPEDTDEWSSEAEMGGASGYDSPENEMTVRPGARVHVTSIIHYPDNQSEEATYRKDMSLKELRKFRA